jgi:hypothetical protein
MSLSATGRMISNSCHSSACESAHPLPQPVTSTAGSARAGLAFVSYHRAQESEVTERDRVLSALVDELSGANT